MAHSVFAIELCWPFERGSLFRRRLHDLVLAHPTSSSYADKWAFYGHVIETLMTQAGQFERGCWDFFDDDGVAVAKYDEWCNGLIAEEGVRRTPSLGPSYDPYRAGGSPVYMTFTMAFLLARGSNSERTLAARCNIDQRHLWHRSVFVSLLHGIRYLNFASVRSDVVYLIPGADEYGLTTEDLASDKFAYLRPVA